MIPVWHITLFDRLTARRAEAETVLLTMRKSGPLLAYLAYHNGKPQSREFLAEMFWPEQVFAEIALRPASCRHFTGPLLPKSSFGRSGRFCVVMAARNLLPAPSVA